MTYDIRGRRASAVQQSDAAAEVRAGEQPRPSQLISGVGLTPEHGMKWQAIVVLHVMGDALDPDALVARHDLPGASVWHKGEPGRRGKPYPASGLKVTVAHVESSYALRSALLQTLKKYARFYSEVAEAGGHCAIDIGLMVPPDVPRTVTFDEDLLSTFLAAKVSLHVSAYPCSDDELTDVPPNDRMQVTAPLGGRAGNGGKNAAASRSAFGERRRRS